MQLVRAFLLFCNSQHRNIDLPGLAAGVCGKKHGVKSLFYLFLTGTHAAGLGKYSNKVLKQRFENNICSNLVGSTQDCLTCPVFSSNSNPLFRMVRQISDKHRKYGYVKQIVCAC